jgi:hypothetical protein
MEVIFATGEIRIGEGKYTSLVPKDITQELLKREDFIKVITDYLREKLNPDILTVAQNVNLGEDGNDTCYKVTVYLEKWTAKPLGTNNSILKEMEEIGL